MARIGKAEHARILHLANVEGRKVAEIAAEYGCSTANIYALLGKLRRAGEAEAEPKPVVAVAPAVASPAVETTDVVDLFAAPPKAVPSKAQAAAPRPAPVPPPSPPPRARPSAPVMSMRKQGYGLVMRSPDGEENLAPFRSLDDLLGAIKPILRAAATSPEPAWFCIQPIDLAALEDDAA